MLVIYWIDTKNALNKPIGGKNTGVYSSLIYKRKKPLISSSIYFAIGYHFNQMIDILKHFFSV